MPSVLRTSSHRVEAAHAGGVGGEAQADALDVHEAAGHAVTYNRGMVKVKGRF